MVSEFSPAGIIGAGKEPTSTILLEVIFGDPPDDFVEVLPGFKLKWTSANAQKELGAFIRVQGRPLVRLTLGWGRGRGVWHEAEHRSLDISKIHGGRVELKAKVHARRPHLRPKLGGPRPFELVRQR